MLSLFLARLASSVEGGSPLMLVAFDTEMRVNAGVRTFGSLVQFA
jgi:hypothetical protein